MEIFMTLSFILLLVGYGRPFIAHLKTGILFLEVFY